MNSDGVHSSTDPRPHATVSASTELMRANRQSIVHHIYFDKTNASESCPEGFYSGHRIHGTLVADPKHVRNSYDTARVHRSVFDDVTPGKTAVGYAPHLKSYYVPDASGQHQQLVTLLPHPSERETWYFTNPHTNQSTTALFPAGCGVPLPTQLPTTPEPDDPVPAAVPSYWETPGEAINAPISYKSATYTSGSTTDPESVSGSTFLPSKDPIKGLVEDFGKSRVGEGTMLKWSGWSWSKQWEQWVRTRQTSASAWEHDYQALAGAWSAWSWNDQWGQWERYAKDPDENWVYDYEPGSESSAGSKDKEDKNKKVKGKGKGK